MPLTAPNLDDRRFDDLVAEARALIPRYTPEWTNHNESDPGIAIMQLFAWFTDLLLFRVNQVPERHYVKFLQLLGIQAKPATPARADLSFVTAKADVDVVVPAGTQVATAGGEAGPVVFEVDEGFTAIGPRLAGAQVYDGISYRDVSVAVLGGAAVEPFGAHAHPDSALLLGFSTPAPFTRNPITLTCYVDQPKGAVVVQAGSALDQVAPPAQFAYEFYDGSAWNTAGLQVDDTRAFTRTGRVVLLGAGTRSVQAAVGAATTPLHWVRIRLASGGYERAPRLASVALNTVAATQALTLRDEVLGGSDGMPDQGPFVLSGVPVVTRDRPDEARRSDGTRVTVRSVLLEIDEGAAGFEPWQEVDDFGASGPDDAHFTCDHTTGEIRFGDGRFGRIPVANPSLPTSNIVARRYRAGGGAAGNVGAHTITALQTAVPGITTVTNARSAVGGADEETVDDAKRRAPSLLKAGDRAVTAEDFVALALRSPATIRRAEALALHHPAFAGLDVPGAVTVIAVPDAPGPAPAPTDATLALLCAFLDQHRLLTTEVFAVGPTYRQVRVVADIVVQPNADLAAVQRDAAEQVTRWLHPLTGGDDGGGWPFGGAIYSSSLFRVLLAVPGVARLRDNQVEVILDGERQTFCRDVELNRGELIEALAPDIRVSYR
jgi:predicted phage baseplate assembly protein